MIRILRTIEDMCEDESLCEYCKADPGWHSTGSGDPYCCEGSYCKDAYKKYLDDIGISERSMEISGKVKVRRESR